MHTLLLYSWGMCGSWQTTVSRIPQQQPPLQRPPFTTRLLLPTIAQPQLGPQFPQFPCPALCPGAQLFTKLQLQLRPCAGYSLSTAPTKQTGPQKKKRKKKNEIKEAYSPLGQANVPVSKKFLPQRPFAHNGHLHLRWSGSREPREVN